MSVVAKLPPAPHEEREGAKIAAPTALGGSNAAAPEGGDRAAHQIRHRLKWGAFWVTSGRFAGVGITMLVNIALARWLSPADFGSFLLLSSVLALGSVLAMQGFNAAVVRFVSASLGENDVARARQSLRLVMTFAAASIAGFAGVALLVFSFLDASVLRLPQVPGLLAMLVAGLVLLSVLQLLAEACRSLHELRLASLFSGGQTGGLLSNLVFLILLAAAIVVGTPSFTAAVVLNLAAMSIVIPLAMFGFWRVARQRLGAAADELPRRELTVRQLLAFSLPLLLIQLLTLVTTQADLLIAGICCPHDQVALYGAARRLLLLVTMPLQIANITVLSSIAELHSQGRIEELELLLRRATTLAAMPSMAAIGLLLVAGGPILDVLFGPFFAQAALPLAILSLGQIMLVGVGSCGCALEMSGNQLSSLVVNFCSAIALVTIGAWAAVHFGIWGLAIVSSSIVSAQSICIWLLAKKLTGVWTHPSLRTLWGGAAPGAN